MKTIGRHSRLLCTALCTNCSPPSTLGFRHLRQSSASDCSSRADRLPISVVSKNLRTSSSLRPLRSTRTVSVIVGASSRQCVLLLERCKVPGGLERRIMMLSLPKPPCTAANYSKSRTNVEQCTWQAICGGESGAA